MDAVSKGTQALVDELGFPEALPLGLSLAHPLTPCQIHQPQLGPPHIPCTYTNTLQTPEEDEYTINVLWVCESVLIPGVPMLLPL